MRSIRLRDIILFLVFLVVPVVCTQSFLENEGFWRQNFPPLIRTQLWWHQFVSRPIPLASVRRPRTKWVAVAEVDDTAFWNPPLSGIQPTNRRFIADVARNAADAGAALVAIDFKLKSPNNKIGDDPVRADDNRYLFASLAEIVKGGTPVVLGCGFVRDADGGWKEEPNVVEDRSLPQLEGFGYINLPEDPRQLPLWQDARTKYVGYLMPRWIRPIWTAAPLSRTAWPMPWRADGRCSATRRSSKACARCRC